MVGHFKPEIRFTTRRHFWKQGREWRNVLQKCRAPLREGESVPCRAGCARSLLFPCFRRPERAGDRQGGERCDRPPLCRSLHEDDWRIKFFPCLFSELVVYCNPVSSILAVPLTGRKRIIEGLKPGKRITKPHYRMKQALLQVETGPVTGWNTTCYNFPQGFQRRCSSKICFLLASIFVPRTFCNSMKSTAFWEE